jgi:hypothetical protein
MIKKQIKELKISRAQTRRIPLEALAAFKYSAHSVPKATNFFISACQGKRPREYKDHTTKHKEEQSLTSSGELVESWTSRETSASFDFFDRLVLRATGTFLIEVLGAFGDFTTGSASCTEGSPTVIFLAEGVMAASLFGSSLSLRKQEETDFIQPKRKKASTTKS